MRLNRPKKSRKKDRNQQEHSQNRHETVQQISIINGKKNVSIFYYDFTFRHYDGFRSFWFVFEKKIQFPVWQFRQKCNFFSGISSHLFSDKIFFSRFCLSLNDFDLMCHKNLYTNVQSEWIWATKQRRREKKPKDRVKITLMVMYNRLSMAFLWSYMRVVFRFLILLVFFFCSFLFRAHFGYLGDFGVAIWSMVRSMMQCVVSCELWECDVLDINL